MRFTLLAPALLLCALAAHAQTDAAAAAAKEPGAVLKPSGLVFLSLRDGNGPSPGPTDTVKVNYRGTFPDGREFDSSYKRGEPIEFPLNGVIKCWTEGVQLMKVGGKAKLTCPPRHRLRRARRRQRGAAERDAAVRGGAAGHQGQVG